MKTNEKTAFLIVGIALVALVVSYSILWYDSRKKALMERVFRDWGKDVQDASIEFGIPVKRIASHIAVESAGDPDATGSIGEIGLMQLTNGAYQEFKKRYAPNFSFGWGFGKSPLYEPRTNIFIGTGYLRILKDRHGSLDNASKSFNSGTQFNDTAGTKYLAKIKSYERQVFFQ